MAGSRFRASSPAKASGAFASAPEAAPLRVLHYLAEFADEVIPCAPTLEAWAAWLAEPDPDWGRLAAAPAGTEFMGYTIEVLADVEARLGGDHWTWTPEPPREATAFFPYLGDPSGGWDAGAGARTLGLALANCVEDQPPVWVACVRDGPPRRYRFEHGAAGPRLVDLGPVS